jgi:hypothetical protein
MLPLTQNNVTHQDVWKKAFDRFPGKAKIERRSNFENIKPVYGCLYHITDLFNKNV